MNHAAEADDSHTPVYYCKIGYLFPSKRCCCFFSFCNIVSICANSLCNLQCDVVGLVASKDSQEQNGCQLCAIHYVLGTLLERGGRTLLERRRKASTMYDLVHILRGNLRQSCVRAASYSFLKSSYLVTGSSQRQSERLPAMLAVTLVRFA